MADTNPDKAEAVHTASVPITPAAIDEAVRREQAAINADLEANPRDETIPGGRILRDGVLVNAWGHEIEPDGKLKNPDDRFHESV